MEFTKKSKSPAQIVIMLVMLLIIASPVVAAKQPNILVIWGDDVGQSNISAYTRGLVGYGGHIVHRLLR